MYTSTVSGRNSALAYESINADPPPKKNIEASTVIIEPSENPLFNW